MPEPWQRVTAVEFCSVPEGHEYQHHFTVTVEYVGNDKYLVRNRGAVLTAVGEWSWSRGDRAVWDFEEALIRAKLALDTIRLQWMTAAQALAHHAEWLEQQRRTDVTGG